MIFNSQHRNMISGVWDDSLFTRYGILFTKNTYVVRNPLNVKSIPGSVDSPLCGVTTLSCNASETLVNNICTKTFRNMKQIYRYMAEHCITDEQITYIINDMDDNELIEYIQYSPHLNMKHIELIITKDISKLSELNTSLLITSEHLTRLITKYPEHYYFFRDHPSITFEHFVILMTSPGKATDKMYIPVDAKTVTQQQIDYILKHHPECERFLKYREDYHLDGRRG